MQFLFSFKPSVFIGFVVLWNAGLLFAAYAGGSIPLGMLEPEGRRVTACVAGLASVFFVAAASSKRLQGALVRPARRDKFMVWEVWLSAVVTGMIAAVFWVSADAA